MLFQLAIQDRMSASRAWMLGLGLLAADLEANRQYRFDHAPTLPCGVTAIGWGDDHEIPVTTMAGWKDVADDYRLVLIDGGHHAFLEAPADLLVEFERDLTSASSTTP
ncbi:hypothetical protein [Micromonospora sp. NPDC047527]|uniref:hypothetical protein n=1 Tax=Micromonospora sp. NPDC047527 TaxID=3155144 RepID=UPI003408F4B0